MVDSKAMARLRGRLVASLPQLPFRRAVILAAKTTDCHVVGGALRDLYFGDEARDLDLTVERGGRLLSERLARSLEARSVSLGGDRFSSYRVVAGNQTIDIWDREGGSLEDDLARRDFTLNSFAVDIVREDIIDPFDGLRDLHDRNLVATSTTTFSSDPLRVLRLCRLVTQIEGARIPPATLRLAQRSARDLDRIPVERIGAELDRLLESTDARPGIETMITLGLYPRILDLETTPGDRGPSISEGDLFDGLRLADEIGRGLPTPIDWNLVRLSLLILGSMSKDDLRSMFSQRVWIARFPLSKKRRLHLCQILSQTELPTVKKNQRWFIHQYGHLWATAVCILAVRQTRESPSEPTFRAIQQIAKLAVELGDELIAPRFLVSGDDLQKLTGLEPGERLGSVLHEVQRRQIEGEVATRAEALALVRHLAEQSRSST